MKTVDYQGNVVSYDSSLLIVMADGTEFRIEESENHSHALNISSPTHDNIAITPLDQNSVVVDVPRTKYYVYNKTKPLQRGTSWITTPSPNVSCMTSSN